MFLNCVYQCFVFFFFFFCPQKKALQALKAPKQEAEKQSIPKRAVDARDAREVARKLFKSGAIPAIQKPQMKQDQMSFKRPKGQERKRVVPESNVASYQPFSATQGSDSFQSANSGTTLDRDSNRVHNCMSFVPFQIAFFFFLHSNSFLTILHLHFLKFVDFSVSTNCN